MEEYAAEFNIVESMTDPAKHVEYLAFLARMSKEMATFFSEAEGIRYTVQLDHEHRTLTIRAEEA